MKKLAVLLICVLAGIACESNRAEKPERLLSEDEMVNILYDLSLLQTMSSTTPMPIQENGIDVNSYIYKKYNIDSLTFVQNQRYYASDIEHYEKMHIKVLDRLKEQQASFDTLNKKSVKAAGRKKLQPAATMPVRE